jgi:hypothetical protein
MAKAAARGRRPVLIMEGREDRVTPAPTSTPTNSPTSWSEPSAMVSRVHQHRARRCHYRKRGAGPPD